MGMFRYEKKSDAFIFYKGNECIKTWNGKDLKTRSQIVADELINDLEKFGADPTNPLSLAAYVYPMLDFFERIPKEESIHSIEIGLNSYNDWTLDCPTADPHNLMNWWGVFGKPDNQIEKGKEWLHKLELHQLCAVTIIGRSLESVNIPFLLDTIYRGKNTDDFIKTIFKFYPYVSKRELKIYFEKFYLYFDHELS